MLSEAKHPVNNGLFGSLRVTVAFISPPSKPSNLVGSPLMAHQPRVGHLFTSFAAFAHAALAQQVNLRRLW